MAPDPLPSPLPSSSEGDSLIAHKVMTDAVRYYLDHGGPAEARKRVGDLLTSLIIYDDCRDAYFEAMELISDYERQQRQAEDARIMKQSQDLSVILFSTFHKPEASEPADPTALPGQSESSLARSLPPELSSERAMTLWHRLQEAGLIDEHYQPVNMPRAKMAYLASVMASSLNLRERWAPFEQLWGKQNMRSDQAKALNQQNISEFIELVKKLVG